jgi:hypothetical protein
MLCSQNRTPQDVLASWDAQFVCLLTQVIFCTYFKFLSFISLQMKEMPCKRRHLPNGSTSTSWRYGYNTYLSTQYTELWAYLSTQYTELWEICCLSVDVFQVKHVILPSMKLKSVKLTLPVNKFSQYIRQGYKLYFIKVYLLLSSQPEVKWNTMWVTLIILVGLGYPIGLVCHMVYLKDTSFNSLLLYMEFGLFHVKV